MPRIRIDDLPPLEQLTSEELAEVFGMGRARLSLGIEQLESRELMAASVTAALVGSTLRVEGTQGDDKITIRRVETSAGAVMQVLSGEQQVASVNATSVTSVEVQALGGNDYVDLASAGAVNSRVMGGQGNDILVGRNDATVRDVLMGGLGNDQLYGLGGDDVLYGGAGVNHVGGGEGNDYVSQAIMTLASASTLRAGDVDLEAMSFSDRVAFDLANRFTDSFGNRVGHDENSGLQTKDIGQIAVNLRDDLGASASNVALTLRNDLSASLPDVARALRVANYSLTDTSRALKHNLNASSSQIAHALHHASYSTTQIATSLHRDLSRDLTQTASALANSGISGLTMSTIASSLWGIGGVTRSSVAVALWNGMDDRPTLSAVAKALFDGTGGRNVPLQYFFHALQSGTGANAQALVSAVWTGIGSKTYSRTEIAQHLFWAGLSGVTTHGQVAHAVFYGTGSSLSQLATAMNGLITYTSGGVALDQVTAALSSSGISSMSARQVAAALVRAFNAGPADIAACLRWHYAGGLSVRQTADALWRGVGGLTVSGLADLLKSNYGAASMAQMTEALVRGAGISLRSAAFALFSDFGVKNLVDLTVHLQPYGSMTKVADALFNGNLVITLTLPFAGTLTMTPNYTMVAGALRQVYGSVSGSATHVLRTLKGLGASYLETARALSQGCEDSLRTIVTAIANDAFAAAKQWTTDAAQATATALSEAAKAVCSALKEFSAPELALVMFNLSAGYMVGRVFLTGVYQTASALLSAGLGGLTVASAMSYGIAGLTFAGAVAIVSEIV
ncbi:MAG: hypothetical protein FJ271_17400 [Planctomycetes bacterium]|nr:hypothetical protein [Planctomycetota bacterium]